MGHLPKYTGCTNCGDEPMQVQTYPQTNCKDENLQDPCVSQKGKFHDKITEDFIVPQSTNQAKMFVCDGSLWAKSQWVALENGADKIAVYPIMATGNKTITIMNGCRSGEDIFGNPDPGKSFPKGTVIFPVPPSGCDSNFCERVAEAIRTCGAEGVYDLLKESELLCFTNTPELDESERGHLFAGTMPDPCNCPSDYGYGVGTGVIGQDPENLWRSCLRKLTKIWTNLGGRTFCFADLPLYNKLNDPDKKGRTLVLNENGCIAKGGELAQECESLDSANDSGADAIKVCVGGVERLLLPECHSEIVACCDEDGENPKWIVRKRGWETLDSIETIYNLSGSQVTNNRVLDFDLVNYKDITNCRSYAIIAFEAEVDSTTSADGSLFLEFYFNETDTVDFSRMYSSGGVLSRSAGVVKVPILLNNKIKFKLSGTFVSSRVVKIKLLAFE